MKSTGYSCPILVKLQFLDKRFKNTQKSNLMKIRPVRAELFRADGQTDNDKSRFSQFANAPQNELERRPH
jgi:hypothetical protein